MSRDFLINKWFLGGVGFLIVLSVACYFWYQHDIAPERKAAAEAEKMLRQSQIAKKSEMDSEAEEAADESVESDMKFAKKPVTETTPMTEDIAPTHAQNETEIAETAEVRVSPYGFGSYPEVPNGFIDAVGKPFWLLPDELLRQRRKPPSRNVELMQRVMVKLWKQGRTDVEAAFMDGDKVRVHFKNRAYVRYSTVETFDGKKVRYISSWRAGNSVSQPQPGDVYPPGEKDVSPGVELIDMDKAPGIDPYEFLGLN